MADQDRDPFCPRHGRKSRPTLSPGLRCDCLEILLAAVAPLREGKWVVGTFSHRLLHDVREGLKERVDRAIAEAVLAAYALGLAGGVPPDKVVNCAKCSKAFYAPYPAPECLTCFAQRSSSEI